MTTLTRALAACALCAAAGAAHADIQITEWMYNGNGPTGEFVELTNLGAASVNLTSWSFDDDSRTPGVLDLSAFGLVGGGESVILTEAPAADFRAAWGLSASVKIVGGNTANLGRADEINIFNAGGALVDRLTYNDQGLPGTVRAQNRSGNPSTAADLLPSTVTTGWVLASAGDSFGSHASTLGDIGNPGVFASPVPESSTWLMLLAGLGGVAGMARRRAA